MLSSIRLLGIAALAAIGAADVIPYVDGACSNPVENYSYGIKNGSRLNNRPFWTGNGVTANYSVSGQYSFETFTNITFDVPASTTTLGQKVFWKVTALDAGCHVMFMKPYQQSGQSTVPGAVVLIAGSRDYCYTSDFDTDIMHMTFCCGGDCSPFNVDLVELDETPQAAPNGQTDQTGQTAQRGRVGQSNGPANSVAKALGTTPQAKVPTSPKLKSREANARGSIAARAMVDYRRDVEFRSVGRRDDGDCGSNSTCYDEAWASCKATITDPNAPPVSKPGKQSALGNFQSCSGNDDCPITLTNTNTYSYEVSVAQTVSDTTGTESSQSSSSTDTSTIEVSTTNGHTLSLDASIGWGPLSLGGGGSDEHSQTNDNTNTQTLTNEQESSQSFSETVANQTQKGTTNSKAESLSQALTIMPGGFATLTFIPYYSCYQVTIDCGTPFIQKIKDGENLTQDTIQSEVCTPTLNSDETVHGSYNLLYTNPSNGDSVLGH